jgi:hypothetical protein
MSKELSAVFNILFSIGGVGAAVFVVAKTSSGMRQESVRRLYETGNASVS